MTAGDGAYFQELARSYALPTLSPARHGRHGRQLISLLATGHAAAYLVDGRLATPPANQIENPDPRPGATTGIPSPLQLRLLCRLRDATQPGVKAIRDYLATLPYEPFNDGNCAAGAYYLVNNYQARLHRRRRAPRAWSRQVRAAAADHAHHRRGALGQRRVVEVVSGRPQRRRFRRQRYCQICDP